MATKIKSTGIADLTTDISLVDNAKILIGTSDDLQLYHDSNNNYINDTGTGALYIKSNYLAIAASNGEQMINAEENAAVELFHNGAKKLYTNSGGATVTGTLIADGISMGDNETIYLGTGLDLRLWHDGSHARIRNTTGNFNIQANDFHITDGSNVAVSFLVDHDAATSLRYNQSEKLATTNTGIAITGTATGAFSGTTSTASGGTNTTALASTAFVQQELTTLIGGAPSTLNDLNELAAAINDDANYNSTLTTALATKLPLAGGTMTGQLNLIQSTSGTGSSAVKQLIYNEGAGDVALQLALSGSIDWYIGADNTDNSLKFGQASWDSAPYLAIDTSGNVGIGTTSPGSYGGVQSQLEVKTSGHGGIAVNVGATSLGQLIFVQNGTRRWGIECENSATPHLTFNEAGAQRMTLDAGGNVGIGETVPLGKLHVKTSDSGATADVSADELVIESSSNTGMTILSGASQSGSIYFGDSGTNWDGYIAYSQASRSMSFGTAAGGRQTIDSSGNVGIGITPNTGWPASTDFRALQIGTGIALWGRGSGDWERGGLTANLYHDGTAFKYMNTGRVTSYEQNDGKHIFKYAASGSANATATLTHALTIDNTGEVGIGVTPESKLHVHRATGALVHFATQDDNNGATNPLSINYTAGLRIHNEYSGAVPSAQGTKVAKIQLSTVTTSGYGAAGAIILDAKTGTGYDSGEMSFATGSNSSNIMTERMRIDKGGNVGIGTTVPSTPLHVSGGTGMTGGWGRTALLAHNFPVLVFQSEYSTDAYAGIGYDNSTGLKFYVDSPSVDVTGNSAAAFAMAILDNKNVGIGTQGPVDKLEVYRTATDQTVGLTLTNNQNGGYGSGIVFRSKRSDNTSLLNAAEMYVSGLNSWNSDATSSSRITFAVRKDNTLATALTIDGTSIISSKRFDVNTNQASNFIASFDQNSTSGYGLAVDSASAHFVFWYQGGSYLGAIQESGGNMVYGGTSDYRLKENVSYTFDATTELKKLKPIEFNFIAHENSTQNGFLAHELQEVVPKAVVGEKDGVDDDGNPMYQNVDPAKLVPLLVKTIQELEARITALEGS